MRLHFERKRALGKVLCFYIRNDIRISCLHRAGSRMGCADANGAHVKEIKLRRAIPIGVFVKMPIAFQDKANARFYGFVGDDRCCRPPLASAFSGTADQSDVDVRSAGRFCSECSRPGCAFFAARLSLHIDCRSTTGKPHLLFEVARHFLWRRLSCDRCAAAPSKILAKGLLSWERKCFT